MKKSSDTIKIAILGSGPNRIGQGIEFDYCCVHASLALREEGYKSIMINCNPETVSTDYDTSNTLYFEPLTIEDVLNIIAKERPSGVIVQFGGQTPLTIALPLKMAGIKILGTTPESIDIAEDREKFQLFLKKFGLKQAPGGIAFNPQHAAQISENIGYPVLVRPSYVLGGRAMEIVYDKDSLYEFVRTAVEISGKKGVLIDKFLEDTIEVDVDAICDGETCVIGGILEHIEEAGIHSGDSAMIMPPYSLSPDIIKEIKTQTKKIAIALEVKGLINIQFAVKNKDIYILEVNPRASRSIPFVSKAINIPLAKLATKIMVGFNLKQIHFTEEITPGYFCAKESVFPFNRFPGTDCVLGPEMKSTGEVMGIDKSFEMAYAKSQIAAGQRLPLKGNIFISVRDRDKPAIVDIAKDFQQMGFTLLTSTGTGKFLSEREINVIVIQKISEGRPNIIDYIKNRQVSLIINTPSGKKPRRDILSTRRFAVEHGIPLITTISGARATKMAIKKLKTDTLTVSSLQTYYSQFETK